MTLSDLYREVKGLCGCLNSAGVPLKCNGNDFNVDFEIKSKDAVVSHIEVKQDLALTWEDIAFICQTCTEVINSLPDKPCAYTPGFKDLYGEVLKRFNEQRKK